MLYQPGTAWTNIAQVVSMEDEDGDDVSDDDIDSDPNNDDPTEDDQDDETLNVFDLALRKQLTTAPPYNYGQLHTFTVQVFNQGNVAATNIIVNDYVPAGYGFAANNGWTSAGPGLIQKHDCRTDSTGWKFNAYATNDASTIRRRRKRLD
ncbi:MAG: hypothetical protein IPG79_04970 [Saprospiraceae bacterium]|nr:hypothetical protein [Saprospiraceae bacterium]